MSDARIEMNPVEAIDDASALSRVYTPGVAGACRAIADDPDASWRLTTRGNSVAVASDGSAVLGLGDIGSHAAVVATGRSDEPNQINNVLAFPGLFRGQLDSRARELTVAARCAAARAIADTVSPADLDAEHIVPSVFDEKLVPAVAARWRGSARAELRVRGRARTRYARTAARRVSP